MVGSVRSVQPIGATLGEGPVWHDAALWFVDIKRQRIYRYDPARDALQSWDAPGEVGWVLPRAGGEMVAGLQTGLHSFDRSPAFEVIDLYGPRD